MYLLTVQYITPHNTLEQMQFLTRQDYAMRSGDEFQFDAADGMKVTLDRKRIYLSTFTPYQPVVDQGGHVPPQKDADEAKLS